MLLHGVEGNKGLARSVLQILACRHYETHLAPHGIQMVVADNARRSDGQVKFLSLCIEVSFRLRFTTVHGHLGLAT